MSSALVRQALELVDPEEAVRKNKKKGPLLPQRRANGAKGQDHTKLFKGKGKKPKQQQIKSPDQISEENIKKLLKLSKPVADSSITDKIIKRAIKGKPLSEYIEVRQEEEKSILFPEESFGKFEKEYFCS